MARAALEWAFADLGCRALGVPLAAWLGAERERVPVGVSLGIPEGGDLGRLLDEVEQRLAEGYQRVKLKVRPGFARLPLAAVRARFAALPLAADGNGAFSPAELAELQALDELGLLFLEQPLAHDDLVEHARLRRRLRTPICLDESLDGLAALDAALALGALDVVNLKSARMGGPAVALAALARCRERALPCWCGGMLETGIGRAAHVALAACPGFTQPGDLSASDRYYAEDIIEPPFRLGPDGTLAVPSGPGLGVELRQELLERRTVARELVVPAC
ncbi:MAG: hypothetical protein KatS3mg102_2515 [Planctomycetota bacterium]|nr:MAG: hypothetical protein KatS3mg102_2515 [Planctomycetota bacterium]